MGFVFEKYKGHEDLAIVLSSLSVTSLKKRELVALLLLCSCCHVAASVMWLFFAVPWGGLWSVTVAFSGHIHLFFFCFKTSLT